MLDRTTARAATPEDPPAAEPDVAPTRAELEFIEDFSQNWHDSGAGRMEGRVMGYLLVAGHERVSSAELVQALGIAAGAVSMATRALVDQGFIRRHRMPGSRSYFFSAHDDIWGGFLTSERRWVFRMESVLAEASDRLDLSGPARHRVLVAREYMRWLSEYNQQMFRDWRTHLAAHEPGTDR